MRLQLVNLPILTGKPGGKLSLIKSRNLLKCLNGATTSRILNNDSIERGNSLL